VLLDRFIAHGDEAAFADLLARYGPLVLGACRRVLQHEQDAEDAFQATFLVLARKAGSINKRQALGNWLYGVAYRVALQVRRGAGRWRTVAKPLLDVPGPEEGPGESRSDLRPILDEEVRRLPTKFRDAVVLCYLEGKSTEEAAAALGCPRGTVLSRLARARDRLRGRLVRRGVILSAGALATFLSGLATEAAPSSHLVADAWQVVQTPARPLSSAAARPLELANAFETSNRWARVKLAAALVLTVGLVGVMLTLLIKGRGDRGGTDSGPGVSDLERMQGTWKMVGVDGQPLPPDQLQIIPPMTIKDDRVQFGQLNATLRLRPEKQPKEMDIVWPDGQVMEGIYAWEGEDLKIRHGAPGIRRPTNFENVAGAETMPMRFRRN
jgi:RNA polymerase sigma factor (sigma-70 family)